MAKPHHNGPTTAKHPPHKQQLNPHKQQLNSSVGDPGALSVANGVRLLKEGDELRNIAAPHGVLFIPVTKETIEAEAFVAPHTIDQAIHGLSPQQKAVIHNALSACLNSPEACDEGFGNQVERHYTQKDKWLFDAHGKLVRGGSVIQPQCEKKLMLLSKQCKQRLPLNR